MGSQAVSDGRLQRHRERPQRRANLVDAVHRLSCRSGAGSILGFWIGNVDLTGAFGFLGSSQIKILSVFASTALVAAHTVTIFSVEERVLLDDGRVEEQGLSKLAPLLDDIKQIWSTYRTLPLPIWDICKVQAFAWGGWFPIL